MALDDVKNYVAVSDRLGTAGQPSEEQLRDVADAGAAAGLSGRTGRSARGLTPFQLRGG